jgi:hypothetical protein
MVKSGSAFVSGKIIPDSPNKVPIRRNLIYYTALNKLFVMDLTLCFRSHFAIINSSTFPPKCVRKDD